VETTEVVEAETEVFSVVEGLVAEEVVDGFDVEVTFDVVEAFRGVVALATSVAVMPRFSKKPMVDALWVWQWSSRKGSNADGEG
jgi:hypothetical protein